MPNNTWDNLIDPHAVARGAATGPSATILDMTPTPNPVTAANELKLGSKIILEATGEYTSAATVANLTLSLWVGTTATIVAASPAQVPSASQTSNPWHLRWQGVVTAVGASGVVYGQGILDWGTSLTAWTPVSMPVTAAGRQTTIDTTTAKLWGIAGTWSAATAGNTARCDDFRLQIMNQGKT